MGYWHPRWPAVLQLNLLKFNSSNYIILLKATGWTATPATDIPEGTARIEVKSLDELAAILSGTPTITTASKKQLSTSLVSPAVREGSGSWTQEKTIYSDVFSSIKMYSKAYYSDGSISNATSSSGLNGFTVGISWTQSNAYATKITDTHWETRVTGTYSYFIGFQGIGTWYSKTITGYDDLYL